jgi:hypothetical protein
VAKAPIFSFDDAFFGGEIVGGPMTSVSDGARKTSEVAVGILGGKKPADIKTPPLEYGPREIRLAAAATLGHQRGAFTSK